MTDPTPTDWRALCAELLKAVDDMPWEYDWRGEPVGPLAEIDEAPFERARTALAQPEPQEAMIPDQYKGYQVHVYRAGFHAGYTHGLTRANAALAQPEAQGPGSYAPFIVKHYSSDDHPSIKGNGFDGLEVGEDRQEAEEFINWIYARLFPGTRRPAIEPVSQQEAE